MYAQERRGKTPVLLEQAGRVDSAKLLDAAGNLRRVRRARDVLYLDNSTTVAHAQVPMVPANDEKSQ